MQVVNVLVILQIASSSIDPPRPIALPPFIHERTIVCGSLGERGLLVSSSTGVKHDGARYIKGRPRRSAVTDAAATTLSQWHLQLKWCRQTHSLAWTGLL